MMKLFIRLLLLPCLLIVSCNNPINEPQIECPRGYILGGIDSAECIEVACPPGYYLGGEDSTECIEMVCPRGYILGGIDSTECIEVECPPGYYLGGEDSTDCIEIVCPPGFILGGIDSTECIEVECPPGYYLGGEDSTDCIEMVCPPGFILGGIDSTECIEVECPPGYYLGGQDSTDCIELICPPGYYPSLDEMGECLPLDCETYFSQCEVNSPDCCPESVLYFPVKLGNYWRYSVNTYYQHMEYSGSTDGIEEWTITEISPDSNIIKIQSVINGIDISGGGGLPDTMFAQNYTTELIMNVENGQITCDSCLAGYAQMYGVYHRSRPFRPYEGEIAVFDSASDYGFVRYTYTLESGLISYRDNESFPGSGVSYGNFILEEYSPGE